jgi:hypothetical protein
MKKKHAIFLIVLLSSFTFLKAQTKSFKTYRNTFHHFTFNIPASWKITKDESEMGFMGTCRPSSKPEIKSYQECYQGIIFRIEYFNTSLDKTLELSGLYIKLGDIWYTSDRLRDSVETEKIEGLNWIGIYHNNICGISCQESGFHAAAGQCEVFYFSDGNKTICISTNGRRFDDMVREELLKTFRFD